MLALHCTALDCSLRRSPHPLFRNGLTNTHSLRHMQRRRRRRKEEEEEDRRTPSTPFSLSALSPATHSLFTTQRRKGRRERARYRGRLKKFSHFRPLSLRPLAACPRLMPAAAAEGRSSFGRARTHRQASAPSQRQGICGMNRESFESSKNSIIHCEGKKHRIQCSRLQKCVTETNHHPEINTFPS